MFSQLLSNRKHEHHCGGRHCQPCREHVDVDLISKEVQESLHATIQSFGPAAPPLQEQEEEKASAVPIESPTPGSPVFEFPSSEATEGISSEELSEPELKRARRGGKGGGGGGGQGGQGGGGGQPTGPVVMCDLPSAFLGTLQVPCVQLAQGKYALYAQVPGLSGQPAIHVKCVDAQLNRVDVEEDLPVRLLARLPPTVVDLATLQHNVEVIQRLKAIPREQRAAQDTQQLYAALAYNHAVDIHHNSVHFLDSYTRPQV